MVTLQFGPLLARVEQQEGKVGVSRKVTRRRVRLSSNSSEDDEDDGDVITTVLSWDEGGELEIAVDLGLSDEGTYLQINGIEIRAEREALEKGLVEAFRDELDL